jgi:hypothetical protein
MADQLATPEDLASALQRDLDLASAVLALEASTAVVQAAAGGQRILLVTDDLEETWGDSDQELRLKQRPIVSVASVTYKGALLAQGTASGTWRRSPNGIWRDCGWSGDDWCAPSPVGVVYSHGYAQGRQELQLGRGVVIQLSKGLFDNPTGIAREQLDDYAIAYAEASAALDASPHLRALLRRQYGSRARLVKIV